jgi:hypothetical protein
MVHYYNGSYSFLSRKQTALNSGDTILNFEKHLRSESFA